MNNKFITIGVVVAILLGIVSFYIASTKTVETFGGYTAGYWDCADGYYVDGTSRIDGDGALSVTSGAFSGAITGETTLTMTGDTNVQDFVQGGGIYALVESDGTSVITAAQVCDSSIITYSGTATEAVASTTLPSDETLLQDCLTTYGDSKTILFRNISIAASTTQLIAGDSITLLKPDGQNVIIAGANSAFITFTRIAASTTVATVDELSP